jgi:hypothetical protein
MMVRLKNQISEAMKQQPYKPNGIYHPGRWLDFKERPSPDIKSTNLSLHFLDSKEIFIITYQGWLRAKPVDNYFFRGLCLYNEHR